MAALRYLSLVLWVAVPLLAYGAYSAYGLPHVIVSYSFANNGHSYDLSVSRHYLSCTFVGPYGVFTVPAEDGRCGWFRFFKATDWAE